MPRRADPNTTGVVRRFPVKVTAPARTPGSVSSPVLAQDLMDAGWKPPKGFKPDDTVTVDKAEARLFRLVWIPAELTANDLDVDDARDCTEADLRDVDYFTGATGSETLREQLATACATAETLSEFADRLMLMIGHMGAEYDGGSDPSSWVAEFWFKSRRAGRRSTKVLTYKEKLDNLSGQLTLLLVIPRDEEGDDDY